jgi:hypothetical protein
MRPVERSSRAQGYKTSAALLAIYFVLLLAITLGNGGKLAEYAPGLSFTSTAADLKRLVPGGDPGFYAGGAISLSENGWFRPDEMWLLNLWPPGFFVIGAALLKVLTPGGPYVLGLAVLGAAGWAGAFMVMRRVLLPWVGPVAAALLPPCLLLLGLFRTFYLGFGIVFTENLATSIGIAAVGLAVLSARERRVSLAVAAGLAFAVTAYLRTTSMYVASFLTILVLLWAVLGIPAARWLHRPAMIRGLGYLAICVITYQAFTLPNRVYNYARVGSFDWSNAHYVWAHQWMPADHLEKTGARFVWYGGGGMACTVDPETCARIRSAEESTGTPYQSQKIHTYFEFRDLAVKTFLTHPVDWLQRKLVFIADYWFSIYWFNSPLIFKKPEYIENTLYLLCLIFVIGASVALIEPILALNAAALLIAYAPVYIFLHLEVRYFHQLKISAVALAMMMGAALWAKWKKRQGRLLDDEGAPRAAEAA